MFITGRKRIQTAIKSKIVEIHQNVCFVEKQAFFVEIAITWTSIAISVAGIMTALKNEIIFTDCLTGLYNRVYLEFLHKRACNKKDCWVSGIMIDLNGFKQINDNY